MARLSEIGEFGFIEKVLRQVQRESPGWIVPPGDDACVVSLPSRDSLILTTDMLVERIHFRLDWQTPEELGYKAIAVNLSDIAAMGGSPLWVLVSLACHPDQDETFLKELYQGMLSCCDETGTLIAGGDTCRGDCLILSVTAVGRCAPDTATTISRARAGQKIFVTGCPGMSGLGLQLLNRFGRQQVLVDFPVALATHLRPRIAWNEAPEVARLIQPGAMTDISDGVTRDLGKICQASQVGALINFRSFPWHQEMILANQRFGWTPWQLALSGGEDYLLLFTADEAQVESARQQSSLLANLPILQIGEITESQEMVLQTESGELKLKDILSGFDHFSAGSRKSTE